MKKCLRPDEVCEILNIDKSTFYRIVREIDEKKRLPAIKVNTRIRILQDDLERYMQLNRVDPLELPDEY